MDGGGGLRKTLSPREVETEQDVDAGATQRIADASEMASLREGV